MEKRTSAQWIKEPRYRRHTIVDPAGWSKDNFNKSWFNEEITEIEFQSRLSYSAVMNGARNVSLIDGSKALRYDVDSSWSHPWTGQLPPSAQEETQTRTQWKSSRARF